MEGHGPYENNGFGGRIHSADSGSSMKRVHEGREDALRMCSLLPSVRRTKVGHQTEDNWTIDPVHVSNF